MKVRIIPSVNKGLITRTVDTKSADFVDVKNRTLHAECWQNPDQFSMNPHPQLTPVLSRCGFCNFRCGCLAKSGRHADFSYFWGSP
ncbi:hypothetical protein AG1IA_00731 [Rhizoctonia solani AG-1 IA]|uniref:Uncharacterized protein n=1 Tax=Thanatephorus cucumeris (strain AG1-IA) TaxID=983506 RepID=L8X4X2_THACA|nr:hypothetical protein AG1IA_00731 [Rhizoctonia solani AG-1 IA]